VLVFRGDAGHARADPEGADDGRDGPGHAATRKKSA
jgi:hypothetical protein